jgi:hypothetical protein
VAAIAAALDALAPVQPPLQIVCASGRARQLRREVRRWDALRAARRAHAEALR